MDDLPSQGKLLVSNPTRRLPMCVGEALEGPLRAPAPWSNVSLNVGETLGGPSGGGACYLNKLLLRLIDLLLGSAVALGVLLVHCVSFE